MQINITLKLKQALQFVCLFCLVLLTFGKTMAQGTLTTTNTPTSGITGASSGITFDLQNSSATARVLTTVNVYWDPAQSSNPTARLWVTTTSLSGPGSVTSPVWTAITGFVPITVTTAGIIPTFSGLNFTLAANTQYRFAIESTNGIKYGNSATTPNIYTTDSVSLQVGNYLLGGLNVGYALNPAPNLANNPRFFTGSVSFVAATPCSGTPTGGNSVSSVTGSCTGVGFNISSSTTLPTGTTGVTYQLQSASTIGGTYTNVGSSSPISTFYNLTQTSATAYQIVATCANGGGMVTFAPVFVPVSTVCYCTASGLSSAGGTAGITNFTLNTINRNSGVTAPYENHLNDTTSLIQGATYPFSVTIPTAYQDIRVHIWIDFNGDGDFVDAGEDVFSFSSSATNFPTVITGNINVPATAKTGYTRLRIRYDAYDTPGANNTPCGTSDYGQVEDYTINVIPCIPVTFKTQPTNQSTTCDGNASFTATVNATGSFPVYQWQYRTSPTGVFQNVPNSAPYSGTNTNTLTITNATAAMSGYEYRLSVSGTCTGANQSSSASLMVTQLVPVVTPASTTICAGSIQAISLTNTLGSVITINEGFDAGIPAGWATQNRSVPIGTVLSGWLQGSVAAAGYPAFSGAPNSFVYSDFNAGDQTGGGNIISNWLFTPSIGIKNGDILTFRTRQPGGTDYPDRLEVRLSSAGASTNVGTTATSVGDFTTLLLTINPSVITGVYPKAWTQFTVTVSGLATPVTGRIAFRVFTPDNGTGANQNQVGLDDVVYTSNGSSAQGVFSTTTPSGGANTIFTDPGATVAYTGNPLTTVYVNPAVTTTYAVTYTTPSGCISSSTSFTVTVNTPAAGSPTLSNTSVCVGNNTFLKLGGTLTGGPGFVHNFQVKAPGASSFTNITAGDVYSFSKDTLNFSGVPLSFNGYQFRDSISTGANCGSVISTVATLTVNPIPVVTISAAPRRNLFPGLTTTLTAAVSSATGTITYQWFRNGVAVPGATNSKLVVGIDGVGIYTVRATAQGCASADSTTTPQTITIGDSTDVTKLFIYPSPNNGKFQVRYFSDINSGSKAPSQVNVYDEKGARVFSKYYGLSSGYQQMNVDLGAHASGIYRVELSDTNGDRIKTGSVMVF